MRNQENGKNSNRKKSRKIIVLCVLLVIVLVLGVAAIYGSKVVNDIKGVKQPDKSAQFSVSEGMQAKEIAQMLKAEGIIENTLAFTLYAEFKNSVGFPEGEHTLNANMSYWQIVEELKKVVKQKESVRVLFKEGETVWDIANRLEENGVCKAQDFINTLETYEFDYDFVRDIPKQELRYLRLEGYLFPDTYDFYLDEAPEQVAGRFLKNFNDRVTDEMRAKAQELGFTLDEIVTLASIIQAEASNPVNMGPVSSVFHNRLAKGSPFPKLQSDVTIFYGRDVIQPHLPQERQSQYEAMFDAYNTYEAVGLPAGPICNPGLKAIEAALNPDDTPYYFFVTDINAKYYYAITNEEHDINVYNARKVK